MCKYRSKNTCNSHPYLNARINRFIISSYVFPLPKKTAEGYQVYITHLADPNPDKFDFIDYAKMFFNVSDVRMKIEEKIPTGDIPIFDMSGFTFKHLMKLMLSLGAVKKYMRITQVPTVAFLFISDIIIHFSYFICRCSGFGNRNVCNKNRSLTMLRVPMYTIFCRVFNGKG